MALDQVLAGQSSGPPVDPENPNVSADGEYFRVGDQWVSKDGAPWQPPVDSTTQYASRLGLNDPAGFAARANSGNLTQDDIAKIGQISSVAPQIDANGRVTNAVDFWSGAVTKAQDSENQANKGSFLGMKMDAGPADALNLFAAYLGGGYALADAPAGAVAGYGGAGDYAAANGGSIVAGGAGAAPAATSIGATDATLLGGEAADATLLGGEGTDMLTDTSLYETLNSDAALDALNSTIASGMTGGGLTAAQIAAGASAATAGSQVANGSNDPNTNTNVGPADPTLGQATDPNSPGAIADGSTPPTNTGASIPAGTSSALSRILDGTATPADWLSVGGVAGLTGLSVAGANNQADTLQNIYNDLSAKRQPYLNQSLAWMNDPSSYINGPGQASLQGVLRGLSVRGNPIGSGTSLGIATDAGLRDWQNAVTGFGNIGLGGQDTQAQVGMNAANATGNIYSDIGRGIGQITNPPTSLAQYLRSSGLV